MSKFRITSRRSDGVVQTHVYDNQTQDIVTETGEVVDLLHDPRCKNMVYVDKPLKPSKPNQYKKEFNELRIQLGMNCNFHCRYCIEGHNNDNQKKESVISLPPKQSAENLVNLLVKNDIRPNRVVFWGGEPFVYWKTVIELVPRIKERMPSVTGFGIITNGSLLTLDKVKFLLENKVSLTVSHDGWSFNVYRNDKDPLDNPKVVEALQYYYDNIENKNMLCFNVVITPENCEISKLPSWFEEKTGRPIRVNFESIVKNDHITDEIVTKFEGKYKKTLMNQCFVAGYSDPDTTHLDSLRSITSDFIGILVNKVSAEHANYYCSAPFNNQVAIDMQGNILRCHGTDPRSNTIGHISEIEKCINDTMISTQERTKCQKCPFLMLCKGGCPMISQLDLDYYCKNLTIYYSAFFASAWKLLFDGTLMTIETLDE